MATQTTAPRLSVIMCTYNPRPDLIARALRAVSVQTLPVAEFELVVVDNNSSPALEAGRLERLAGRPVNLVMQTLQGLTYARVAGIEASNAQLICFIDDDNEIAPDYLENALKIASDEPALGMFGGVADGALERRIGAAKAAFLPFLGVRNLGAQELTGSGRNWGPWEPIGAGLCVRRAIAEQYAAFVNTTQSAGGLGRRGGALLSGEDSLISRIGDRLGFEGGYRPALSLRHHITAPRLTLRYLARLMEGHGRSYVILENICGRDVEIVGGAKGRKKLFMHFLHRLKSEGPHMAAGMFFWDLGNFRQSREQKNIRDLLAEIAHPEK
ncbi:MAG: glycosyltransferase family 2 protein [Parvularculaceae bacterium]|nr:glycosyltransferase family 2 protein [Parvularculaceae bacterium]